MTMVYLILCILNPWLFVWHLSSFQLRPDYHGLWWRDSRTIVGTVGKPWSWWWCFCFLPHGMPPVITCAMVKCGKATLWQGDIMFHAWNSQVRARNDTRNIQWWHFNFQSVHIDRGLGISLSWFLVYQCCTEKHTPNGVIFEFFWITSTRFRIFFMKNRWRIKLFDTWAMGHPYVYSYLITSKQLVGHPK